MANNTEMAKLSIDIDEFTRMRDAVSLVFRRNRLKLYPVACFVMLTRLLTTVKRRPSTKHYSIVALYSV